MFTNEEDKIHVYDFVKGEWKSFKLYNPTYSNSVTGDVRYADQMDFDHSGEYLMYDAFNEISKSTGGEYTYWDIGFLHVFDKSKNTFGTGKIEKLIASLPENTSVGNPVFSKNSLDVGAGLHVHVVEVAVIGGTIAVTHAVETTEVGAGFSRGNNVIGRH